MRIDLRQAGRLISKLCVVFDKYLQTKEITIKDAELMVRVWRKCDATNDIIISAEELAHEDLGKLNKDAEYLLKKIHKWHELVEYSMTQIRFDPEFDTQILCDKKMEVYYKRLHLKELKVELFSKAIDLAYSLQDQYDLPLEASKKLLIEERNAKRKFDKACDQLDKYKVFLKEKEEKIDSRWYCNQLMFSMLIWQLDNIAVSIQEDIDNILYEREGNHEEC